MRQRFSGAVSGLLLLAILYTLYVARDLLLPITIALVLKFLLAPAMRILDRLRVPRALGAAVVLAALVASVFYGGFSLADPARAWLAKAPATIRRLEVRLQPLREPVQQMNQATDGMQQLAGPGPAAEKQTPGTATGLGASLLGYTWYVLGKTIVILVCLYYLLVSGDFLLRRSVHALPALEDKKRAVAIGLQIEQDVSTYLGTVTLINGVLGVAVGLAMAALHMPNPALWGVFAAMTNYIPIFGPLLCCTTLWLVAILTYDRLGTSLIVPGAYFLLHLTEGYFVTPFLVARRLTLNPLAIFLSVTFWGWIWGVAGAVLAVPILAILKIFCDHIEPLASIGEFLGQWPSGPSRVFRFAVVPQDVDDQENPAAHRAEKTDDRETRIAK